MEGGMGKSTVGARSIASKRTAGGGGRRICKAGRGLGPARGKLGGGPAKEGNCLLEGGGKEASAAKAVWGKAGDPTAQTSRFQENGESLDLRWG